MLEGEFFVDQMIVVNLTFVPGMAAGFFKDTTESHRNALGDHIRIGANQHTAEKLLIGIDGIIQFANGALDLHHIDAVGFYSFFDLCFQLFRGCAGYIACNVTDNFTTSAQRDQKHQNQHQYGKSILHGILLSGCCTHSLMA